MAFEYSDDSEAEEFVELNPDVVKDIIRFYKTLMSDETVAPGKCGKTEFFEEVIKRSDFLPKPIQTMIDNNRGRLSCKDYLFIHTYFNKEFSTYLMKK